MIRALLRRTNLLALLWKMGSSKSKEEKKCICVGLDASGKSTLINMLKPEKKRVVETNATVGYAVEQFKYGAVNFTVHDMSGQSRYRNLWEHYYSDAAGIIYVIDSADTVRLCIVKDELESLLAHKDIADKKIPVLFFANKMDLPKALTPAQVSDQLELPNTIKGKSWKIVASNALTGQGLEEGMKWFSEAMNLNAKKS